MTKLIKAALGTALSLTLLGCGWTGVNERPLPLAAGNGDDAITVVVQMENAVNLVPNSEVKVNDVTVGSVRRIEFDDWQAKLTIGLEPDVELPRNTHARIGQKSLLGAEYLELAPPTTEPPRGALSDGDTIGLARTGRYPETEELFAALATVLNGGGLNQIGTITAELNAAFGGREADVRRLVNNLNSLIGALDSQRDRIVAVIEGVNQLASTFAADRAALSRALRTLPQAVDVLRAERAQFTRTLDDLGEFGDRTTDLLRVSKRDLDQNLKNLVPVLNELGNAGTALTNFLADITFPFPLEGLITSAKGDYLNLFLTVDITTTAITRDLLGGISPLDAVYAGLTGSPTSATSSGTSNPLDLEETLAKLAETRDTPPEPADRPPAPDPTQPANPLGDLLRGLTKGLV